MYTEVKHVTIAQSEWKGGDWKSTVISFVILHEVNNAF